MSDRATTGDVGVPPAAPVETRGRGPWFWAFVASSSALAIAIIGLVFLVTRPPGEAGADPSPSPTTSTPRPTATSDIVLIEEDGYLDRPSAEVRDELVALGFGIVESAGPDAPTPELVGAVAALSPLGNLAKGTAITMYVYGDFPPPSAPTITSISDGASGEIVVVSFAEYTGCPAGHPLDHYEFTLYDATFAGEGNPVPASATSIQIMLGDAGSAGLNYVAVCAGGITSARSHDSIITVD